MKCPCCGGDDLTHDTRDVPFTYKGQKTVIQDVTADYCPDCGEFILNRLHGDAYSTAMGDFQKKVNAQYLDPKFIADVRKKLDLDQRQAGEIFGGGVNAFSRYENGKTKPPVALVKLLRVLDKHPDLLAEVRA